MHLIAYTILGLLSAFGLCGAYLWWRVERQHLNPKWWRW